MQLQCPVRESWNMEADGARGTGSHRATAKEQAVSTSSVRVESSHMETHLRIQLLNYWAVCYSGQLHQGKCRT